MEEERDDESLYPDDLLKIAKDPDHLGRMNDPSSSAYIKGPCGDEMEFYLVIDNGVIKDIAFYSEGCIATRICGEMTSKLAKSILLAMLWIICFVLTFIAPSIPTMVRYFFCIGLFFLTTRYLLLIKWK